MPGSDRPVDGEVVVASRLRVLFKVVKVVYKRWAEGAIASDAIKEIYSSTWLDMFETWLSQASSGLSDTVRGIGGLVK